MEENVTLTYDEFLCFMKTDLYEFFDEIKELAIKGEEGSYFAEIRAGGGLDVHNDMHGHGLYTCQIANNPKAFRPYFQAKWKSHYGSPTAWNRGDYEIILSEKTVKKLYNEHKIMKKDTYDIYVSNLKNELAEDNFNAKINEYQPRDWEWLSFSAKIHYVDE